MEVIMANPLLEVFKSAGEYIVEGGTQPKFVGSRNQVDSLRRAMLASKMLYETLSSDNSTIDAVMVALNEKKEAARNFKNNFGIDWPF
jgi:hypothetical protein